MIVAGVPEEYGLLLATLLFVTGLIGVLVRRNLLFILMSIEIMLNAAGVAFVTAGAHWGVADGQIMFILILTLAAAEVAVGLAFLLQIHRRRRNIDADRINELKG